MNRDQIIYLILDFLEASSEYDEKTDTTYYFMNIPNTIHQHYSSSEMLFNKDWNWFMYAWNEFHRKIIIPMVQDNPHLRRKINEQIKDMKSCLKWVRLDAAYNLLGEMIEYYNNQFK